MVSSRKRGRLEMEGDVAEPPKELSMIDRIRNMWEFANLAQWIYIFGRAVKIDETLDVEDLEMECLKTQSTLLTDIGLALLKFVSSHRGLTPEIFDEYTRRQYIAKAPQRNPFGDDEEPLKFAEFDVFTKIRVLQQLTQWTMGNPDRIRERMEEQKDSDQIFWRIEPFGWDSQDRTYIVLDDNRLYRRTDPPPPPPPASVPKKGSKKAKAALRASKRRKVSEPVASDSEAPPSEVLVEEEFVPGYDGLGGMKWECIAITLEEFNAFIATLEKSRDANEKELKKRLQDDVLSLLEKQDEARKRKIAQKEREMLNLEKLASAKRSSRIAGKLEQHRQEEESRETERKKQAELVMAKKEQEKWLKLEKERESRMMTREQRVKEREARRILHEEELAALSEDNKKIEAGEARLSERHLKAEMERKKQALEELAEEDDDWVFDCICGAYGQVDDGTLSIACEKCNVWQHTKCVGVSDENAGREDFQFICKSCIRRAERAAQKAAERAAQKAEQAKRPTITIKLGRPSSSSSNAAPTFLPPNGATSQSSEKSPYENAAPQLSPKKGSPIQFMPTRPTYDSPYSTNQPYSTAYRPPYSYGSNGSPAVPSKVDGRPPSQGSITPGHWTPYANGHVPPRPNYPNGQSPFSSPHPNSSTSLPPPYRSPNYPIANGHVPLNAATSPGPPSASTPGSSFSPSRSAVPATTGSYYGSYQSSPGPNGHYQPQYDQTQRQPSIQLPSPLTGARVLSPPYIQHNAPSPASRSQYVSPIHHSHSTPLNVQPSPAPELQRQTPSHSTDPSNAPALPPSSAGISPMKHSPPPRPGTSDGPLHFGTPAPTVLPPITALVPSPPLHNFSPPVKSAESEKNRWPGNEQVAAP